MSHSAALLLGLFLGSLGWMLPRRVARTPWQWSGMTLLDALLPLGLFACIAALSGRPIFAGIVTLATGAAYAYADRSKRRVLAEPVVYTDVFQAPDIFRHPELALPFPHKGRILTGVLAGLAVLTALYLLEGPAIATHWARVPQVAAGLVLAWGLMAGPLNRPLGRWLRRQVPTEQAAVDANRFGPLACLLAYGILARAERPGRQERVHWHLAQRKPSPDPATRRPNVLLVQCESFFDARRLHPTLQGLPMAAVDGCREVASQWGRLSVPTWGANTVRTEFAVLTGLQESQLGLDRFNPYHRFARRPISSLAWQLRTRGYKTICVHPFDRLFYGRDVVLPNLGFDEFHGEEAFSEVHRINRYIADADVAKFVESLLAREQGPVFVFVITMENHGPWTSPGVPGKPWLSPAAGVPASEFNGLQQYLDSLVHTDRMIGHLRNCCDEGDVFAFYGDHLPSFPASFRALDLADTRSDYAILRTSSASPAARGPRKDLYAHALGDAVLAALDEPAMTGPSAAPMPQGPG